MQFRPLSKKNDVLTIGYSAQSVFWIVIIIQSSEAAEIKACVLAFITSFFAEHTLKGYIQ